MIKHYDAAVIGGGLLGCFTARNLRKWNISTVLLEASEDVCTGISKANTAVVYAGAVSIGGSKECECAFAECNGAGIFVVFKKQTYELA